MTSLARLVLVSALLSLWVASASAQTWVFGGPGSLEGRFQDAAGQFDAQGWQDVDCTPDDLYWQVDTYNAANLNGHGAGNHALWAGQNAAQQPDWVHPPGYGNQWSAAAEWRSKVSDATVATTVGLDFYYNYDSEETYDLFMVEWYDGAAWHGELEISGSNKNAGSFDPPGEHFQQQWVIQPSQYTGDDQDEVRLRLFFRSDSGVSDQDGLLGFDFDGAVQADDIVVSFDGVPVDGGGDADGVATFENGDDEGWTPLASPCDCAIYTRLPADYDPSGSNPTPVVARILDASRRFSGRCIFTSPYFGWSAPGSPDGAFLEFDSLHWSTDTGFGYEILMTWRVGGVWQPIETVFVGDVPVAGWQRIHVDLTGIAPVDADMAAMAIDTGFGDGNPDVVAFDNVALGRFDTAVAAPEASTATALLGVHPNPANPRATVAFRLGQEERVTLNLFDLRGRKVRTLIDEPLEAGIHRAVFDGRDDRGRPVASGSYLVRLQTPTQMFARRLTLVK